jgi:hypothetical protein
MMSDEHNHTKLANEVSALATRRAYPHIHESEIAESPKAQAYREAYWVGYYTALFQFCRCQEPWPSEKVAL